MPISPNKAIPAYRQTAPGKYCRVHRKVKANFALIMACFLLYPY